MLFRAEGRENRSEEQRLNSSHVEISYAVFCLKKKTVGQDTASSSLASDPAGPETGWMAQLVPFHRSASGVVAPVLPDSAPTAVQARAEAHETAKNPAWGKPAGAGTDWRAQLVPFHSSASG